MLFLWGKSKNEKLLFLWCPFQTQDKKWQEKVQNRKCQDASRERGDKTALTFCYFTNNNFPRKMFEFFQLNVLLLGEREKNGQQVILWGSSFQ